MLIKTGYSNKTIASGKISNTKTENSHEIQLHTGDTVKINGLPLLETPKKAIDKLATGFGYVEFPQASPDGKKVVFNVVGDYDTSQMLIMDSDGKNIRSLFTEEPLSPENTGEFLKGHKGKIDEQGTWSRDGKTIYYRSNQKGTFGIARYDMETSDNKLLVHNPKLNMKHPVEMENGFIAGYGGEPGEKYPTTDKCTDIFIANPEDGSYKLITHTDGSVGYKHPSVMNGFILAHKEDKTKEDVSDIVKLDPKTGKEVNLTKTPEADERHPFYNEKRDLLAFHSDETGDKNIWISTPDGSRRCQLTFYGNAAQSPCWSPDGKKIYFVKKLEKQPEGHHFFERQADIRVIDVKKALEEIGYKANIDIVSNQVNSLSHKDARPQPADLNPLDATLLEEIIGKIQLKYNFITH